MRKREREQRIFLFRLLSWPTTINLNTLKQWPWPHAAAHAHKTRPLKEKQRQRQHENEKSFILIRSMAGFIAGKIVIERQCERALKQAKRSRFENQSRLS